MGHYFFEGAGSNDLSLINSDPFFHYARLPAAVWETSPRSSPGRVDVTQEIARNRAYFFMYLRKLRSGSRVYFCDNLTW